jgi:hypothetical protein
MHVDFSLSDSTPQVDPAHPSGNVLFLRVAPPLGIVLGKFTFASFPFAQHSKFQRKVTPK